MEKQKKLVAKEQEVKEEHQLRVEAKKKGGVQKKAGQKGKAKSIQSCYRAKTSPQGKSGSSSFTGPGYFGPGCTPGGRGHIRPRTGILHVRVLRGKKGMSGNRHGRLNLNGEDLCPASDYQGCSNACPMCQGTTCGPICRQNQIVNCKVTANEE